MDISLRMGFSFHLSPELKLNVACSVQAELGQMTATVYYDANSVALDSKLLILQNTFIYRVQHESQ